MAHRHGMDFKKIDDERGQLLMEASASSGFPMAVAHGYLWGNQGFKQDEKKAFDMYAKINELENRWVLLLLI